MCPVSVCMFGALAPVLLEPHSSALGERGAYVRAWAGWLPQSLVSRWHGPLLSLRLPPPCLASYHGACLPILTISSPSYLSFTDAPEPDASVTWCCPGLGTPAGWPRWPRGSVGSPVNDRCIDSSEFLSSAVPPPPGPPAGPTPERLVGEIGPLIQSLCPGQGQALYTWHCGDPDGPWRVPLESCSWLGHEDVCGSTRGQCGRASWTQRRVPGLGGQSTREGQENLAGEGVHRGRRTPGRAVASCGWAQRLQWLPRGCLDVRGRICAGPFASRGWDPGREACSDASFPSGPDGPCQRQDECHLLVPGEQQRHPPPAPARAHLRGA